MKNLCIIVSFSILFMGCKDFFENPLAEYEIGFKPKLYLYSIISPNLKNTTVEVKRNRPITGEASNQNNTIVTNAKVCIFEGKDTMWLWFDNINNIYRISSDTLSIKPNRSYQLFVSTPDGLFAQSACTVPDTLIKSEDIKPYFTSIKESFGDSTFSAQIAFKNLEGEQDFYDVIYQEYNYFTTMPTLNSEDSWGLFQGKNNLGNTLTTKAYTYTPQYLFNRTRKIGYLKVLLTDENYYRYHQTIKDQQKAKENPFAEDSPVFTNIKGGLGIFAAFTQKRILL
jgi:Domain of unknown function (DUF4249)